MTKRCKTGQIVAVTFWDHTEDSEEPMLFTVYGRVSKNTRKYVCIDSWEYADQKVPYDTNEKRFTIVRTGITGIEVLKDVAPARGREERRNDTPSVHHNSKRKDIHAGKSDSRDD